jgi:hypothetical protein
LYVSIVFLNLESGPVHFSAVLQSIPFKNAVDVASNGERFTLTNAANLKTYILSKINKKKVIKELTVVVF